MNEARLILEMGMGNDLCGRDYTKAAIRAVEDAIRHSSIPLFDVLEIDHAEMRVQVTVGVQDPEAVDLAAVTAHLPRGRAEVTAVMGGLDVATSETGQVIVIASAAVEAFLPKPLPGWRAKV